MNDIKAGVVLVQKFCQPGSETFSNYIDYIDREEAIRQPHENKYNLFSDYVGNYMDNREKTTGIFTQDKDALNLEEKKKLKELFSIAQENESLMWQTVVSFDNEWLKKNGIISGGILHENELKSVARKGIQTILKKENLEMAVWSASIHYNTDNIHIHYAIVEPTPMREKREYQGKLEYRGKMKLSSLEQGKSIFVNSIIQSKDVNKRLTEIIRNNMLKTNFKLMETDLDFQDKFLEVFSKLESIPLKFWNYNAPKISNLKKSINELSKDYIDKYLSKEMKEIEQLLEKQESLYIEGYGGSDGFEYKENKLKDLYERFGNRMLKEMKALAKNIEKQDKNEISEKENDYEAIIEKVEAKKEEKERVSLHDPVIVKVTKQAVERLEGKLSWNEYRDSYYEAKEGQRLLEKNSLEGTHHLSRSLENGNQIAGVMLAEYHLKNKEPQKAREILQETIPKLEATVSFSKGYLKDYLAYQIGKAYLSGILGKDKIRKSIDYFEQSSLPIAKYQQGKYLVKENYKEAKEIFEAILIQNTKREKDFLAGLSHYQLGKIEERVIGNETKAYYHYLQAHHHLEAPFTANKLGFMNYQGKGVSRNLEVAMKYFNQGRRETEREMSQNDIGKAMSQKINKMMNKKSKHSKKTYILPTLRQMKKYFGKDMKAVQRSISEYDQMLEKIISQDYKIDY